MKKVAFILLFCIYGFIAGAQVTVEKNSVTYSGLPSMISIRVLDAATDHPLSGAHVKIIFAPGDTVAIATDNSGMIAYTKRFPADSLSLMVSYVGYKTVSYTYKPASAYAVLTVRLLEDIITMNAIIIKGDRIAMVLKGDTIFYNASAFKTMRGDNVEELLKKLPGVEFRDGKFFANGEPVNRILINGMELFGTDTGAAGRLIRADEVKNVKVYDYYSNEKRRSGDTLDAKERVLDVTTHTKTDMVKNLSVAGSAGQYTDKNERDERDPLYTFVGNYSRYRVGERFLSQLNYSKNTGLQRSGNSEEWKGILSWNTQDTANVIFKTDTYFNDLTIDTYSCRDRSYFSSLTYDTRNYISELFQESHDRSLTSSNSIGARINKNNRVWLSVDGSYTKNSIDNINTAISTTDEIVSDRIHMQIYDLKNDFNINATLLYSHKFKPEGRTLELSSSYVYRNGDGNGWNIDTLASSINQMFLESRADRRGNAYHFLAGYEEPVAENVNMNLGYRIDKNDDRSKRIAMSRLTNATDTLNTYDYTLRDLTHLADVWISYKKNKAHFSGGVSFQSVFQQRDEAFPEVYAFPKTFNNILFQFGFSYEASLFRLHIDYNEHTLPVSVEELRGVIDNSNPLFLKAGNPGLKPPVSRTIKISSNIVSIMSASSLDFVIDASFVSGYLARKTRYFSQPAGLPEYNYTAAAGTTLETSENVQGKWSLNADVTYAKNSLLLESTLRAMVKYGYDRTPFFVSDDQYATDAQNLSVMLAFQSGFSRFVEISLFSTTRGSYSKDDNHHTYKSFRQSGYGHIRVNFLKRCWLTGSISYRYNDYITSGFTQEETLLGASFQYKFGKDDKGEIGVHANDLLNQVRSIGVTMREDYIETSRNGILGRNASLSFSYRF